MTKPFIAILLVFITQSALLGETALFNSIKEIIAKGSILSKSDQFESFIDGEMHKIGVWFNQDTKELEKRFDAKFAKYKDSDGDEVNYICIDSGGFYIILTINPEEYMMKGLSVVGFKLYKPSKATCKKQKLLDISATYLNKPSEVLQKKLNGLEATDKYQFGNRQFYWYSKYDHFFNEIDENFGILRTVGFGYSESPLKVIDGYDMSLAYEWD
ncbi:MAG: hypothetical protein LBC09_07580 [Helicobacteraceae bacterium]|jgi:hypothetical protein|nr:hypothetical protein [Helicobacteraceae bacterium]